MAYSGEIGEKHYGMIERVLSKELIDIGVQNILLIDLAGNIIIDLNNGKVRHDIYSLAALAAGNLGAVTTIAHIIGEADFSSIFHKGEKDSVYLFRITEKLVLIAIFGKNLSLVLVRRNVAKSIAKIRALI